ncbi:TraK protein [compost metagenome]
MSPTCANKPMMLASKPLLTALLLAASLVALTPAQAASAKAPAAPTKGKTIELPEPGVVSVSDYEFNTFVFSEPAKRFIFPAGSPVNGDPITLAGGTQVLLQFMKGADRPVQMVVELQSGRVEKLRVVPKAIPGVTYPVNGARIKATGSAAPAADVQPDASPRAADIELLKHLTTSGQPPEDFQAVTLPLPTRFDKFTVVPLAGWSNGERRIMVFSLVAAAGQTAVVSPNQFYRDGITAVLLDGDTVDANTTPQLFVVEELKDE